MAIASKTFFFVCAALYILSFFHSCVKMLLAQLLLCVRVAPATPVWVVLPLLFLCSMVGYAKRTQPASTFCQWTRLALCVSAWPQKLSLLLLLVVLCRNRVMRGGLYVEMCHWGGLAVLLAVVIAGGEGGTSSETERDWVVLVLALFASAVSCPSIVQHAVASCLLVVLRSQRQLIQDQTRWMLLPALLTELPPLLKQDKLTTLRALYAICSAVTLGACASMWQPLLLTLLSAHVLFFLSAC